MFQEICENFRCIERAISEVEQELKHYISIENDRTASTYTNIYSYLVTCRTEVRVLKLAYEYYTFTPAERDMIIGASTLEGKWTTALNIGFCKGFGLPDITQRANYMSADDLAKYDKLLNLIQMQLNEAITIRNKISHGQWVFALNTKNTALNNNITTLIQQENYLLIRLRSNTFEVLTQIIHDLCVSKPTFMRDFNKHIHQIDQYFDVYKKQGYEKFKSNMIAKYKRGLVEKRENIKKRLEQ